jgi:hypothetical protein
VRYLLCFFCVACAAPRSDVRATLHAQTQELLDAVSDGKPAVWQRLLDPDVTYVAEDGTRETRPATVRTGSRPGRSSSSRHTDDVIVSDAVGVLGDDDRGSRRLQ